VLQAYNCVKKENIFKILAYYKPSLGNKMPAITGCYEAAVLSKNYINHFLYF